MGYNILEECVASIFRVKKISQPRSQQVAGRACGIACYLLSKRQYLLHGDFLVGSFDPEDGGGMFLRNVG
jgi:hypothetical protein